MIFPIYLIRQFSKKIWTDLNFKGLKIKDDSDNVTGQQAVYTICHYRMGGNLRKQKKILKYRSTYSTLPSEELKQNYR